LVCAKLTDPDSGVVMRGVGVDNEEREFGGNIVSIVKGTQQLRRLGC
jgi:hypothetical protein